MKKFFDKDIDLKREVMRQYEKHGYKNGVGFSKVPFTPVLEKDGYLVSTRYCNTHNCKASWDVRIEKDGYEKTYQSMSKQRSKEKINDLLAAIETGTLKMKKKTNQKMFVLAF